MNDGRFKRSPQNERHLGPWRIVPPIKRRYIVQALVLVVLAFLTIAGPTQAQVNHGNKPAWKWSAEERLSARLNPAYLEARHKNRELTNVTLQGYAASEETVDVINGGETPELFLNWELFDQLMNLGFDKDEESTRHLVEQRAAALGFGSDMWHRLESVTMPLLKLQHEEKQVNDEPGQAMQLCRVRAKAIRAAQKEFGEEQLGRLLYQAVAPTVSRVYVVNSDLADHLRLIEGGCK
jgi:hypothetical protein